MSKLMIKLIPIFLLIFCNIGHAQFNFGHSDDEAPGSGWYSYSSVVHNGNFAMHKIIPATKNIGFTWNRLDLDTAQPSLVYYLDTSGYQKYLVKMTYPGTDTIIGLEYGSLDHSYYMDSMSVWMTVSYLVDLGVADPYAANYTEGQLSYATIYSNSGTTLEEITDTTRSLIVGIRYHDAGNGQTYKRFFKP